METYGLPQVQKLQMGNKKMIEEFPIKKSRRIYFNTAMLWVCTAFVGALSLGLYLGIGIVRKNIPDPEIARKAHTDAIYRVCSEQFMTAKTEAAYYAQHRKCQKISEAGKN